MPPKDRPKRERPEVAPVSQPTDPRLIALTASELQIERSSGPLPDPEVLLRYEGVVPGSAEKIIAWAEAETQHRRQLETKFADADIADLQSHRLIEHLGQICALVLALFAIGSGTYAIVHDHATAGTLLGGGTVVSLVSAFIYGRSKHPG
jgi:uncharacterized membrane protein